MDREANEVFYEDNDTVFAGSVDVIPDVTYYQLIDNSLDDFLDNFYEENYPAIYELGTKSVYRLVWSIFKKVRWGYIEFTIVLCFPRRY
ncbi:hypothetical protein [Peribacillus frigoritolerans]|uniref:hypothetical protein n=1 Tax=Peribacillus frigoritolerans TaxID=450367 RepID=UPI0039A1A938